MNEKKEDRRSNKTKRMICSALAELLAEKALHKITVQEISDIAEISRTTFYKYYVDVYDLYDQLSKSTMTELELVLTENKNCSEDELYSKLIEYVSDNRMTFRMIFSPNTTAKLKDKLIKMIEGVFRHKHSEKYNIPINSPELIYFTGYRAHGFVSVIQKWVRTDFKESRGYMVKIISVIDKNMENTLMAGIGDAPNDDTEEIE